MKRHALGPNSRAFREAVEWIALEDAPGDREPVEAVADYLTVVMLSDLSGVPATKIARRVVRIRKAHYGA